MDPIARIGSSIHVKGSITANEPLTIAGHVDGTIEVNGHVVTIDAGGRLDATVAAETIIVSGSVKGSLIASARIVVRETASVEGDMAAPLVNLADGASVRGRVETAERRSTTASVVHLDAASSAA